MSSHIFQDLTGQIQKTELYPFACGGNAEIWEGSWVKEDSGCTMEVAVKVCKRRDGFGKNRLLREMRIWSAMRHPNIMPFWGIAYNFDQPCMPCLVSPYYRHGNITSYIAQYSNANKWLLLAQTSLALSHLHGLSIVHGDIKGTNILIDDNGEARLIDFSLSRVLHTSRPAVEATMCWIPPEACSEECNPVTTGGWRWKAPELMANEDEEFAPRVTMATDVWAFAMTVVEIFTESVPFSHIKRDAQVIISVMSGGHPKRERCWQIENDIWRMLESCWDVDPNRRPSMATLSHFFSLQGPSVTAARAHL